MSNYLNNFECTKAAIIVFYLAEQRSILFGRELLEQGIRWGIGDGQATKILVDNWIPDDAPPDRLSTLIPMPLDATVDLLLDPDSGVWNEEVVGNFFPADITSKIMRVPLSQHGGADFASWPHARFGIYIVCSAYNLARHQEFVSRRSLSGRGLSLNVYAEIIFGRIFGF